MRLKDFQLKFVKPLNICTIVPRLHEKWVELGNLARHRINERISLGLVVLVAVVHVSSMATSSALVRGTGTAQYDL